MKEMVKPGRACMVVYSIEKGIKNKVLFRLQWEEAPLMLTLNCDHFNKVMCQHAIARYANEDVRSMYGLVLPGFRDPSSDFKDNPLQMGVFYAYDTGITRKGIDCFLDVICSEVGHAFLSDPNCEHLYRLFVEYPCHTQRAILFQREKCLSSLSKPTVSNIATCEKTDTNVNVYEDDDEGFWTSASDFDIV